MAQALNEDAKLDAFWLDAKPLPFLGDGDELLINLSEGRKKLNDLDSNGANGLAALDNALALPQLRGLLIGICETSTFLRDLMAKDPQRLSHILSQRPDQRIADLASSAVTEKMSNEGEIKRHLRLIKQDASLTIALADLSGLWSVKQVTNALTTIADATLRGAFRFSLQEHDRRGKISLPYPDDPERDCGYFALAMGKHGAGELNYSSDIDLIIIYDGDNSCCSDKWEMSATFVRMTKLIVKIMQDRTADGYVFRTDLRLRPDPGATPPAVSVLAALQYYESMGQNWERAALIKARPCAGDIAAGDNFLTEIVPFIWRKYFDFAALADVHSIKRQINAHKGHGTIAIKGHNVKLGRGGIREIEFFVQTQQLIAGGRNPALRGRETIPMLSELVELTWIEPIARDELTQAYEFLRKVEHRIQMQRDEQSHLLPQSDEGVAEIGRMMGYADDMQFKSDLRGWLECVQGHYVELFKEEQELGAETGGNLVFTGEDDDPETLETLGRMGFTTPTEVTKAIRSWHFGRYPATRSTKARERLTEFTPDLLKALGNTDNPDAAFISFNAFLSALPSGVQVFSLLRNNPQLLEILAIVLGASPRLAKTVARRPRVIDALLDPAFFGNMLERDALNTQLERMLQEASCYEEALDGARIFGQEQLFLIGVRILMGSISASQAGAAYAMLAGVIVRHMLAFSQLELERRHGKIPGGQVAVIAMGKLGGREMTAGSDLDLMLLYDHDKDVTMSDGDKPLAPTTYYARLTQRLITALSAPTAEGDLYEVDFRLRPSGNSGPLATSLTSFKNYHAKDAWTWEHMAMTRSRIVAGDADFSAVVRAEIVSILSAERDKEKIRTDIADMRGRLQKEKRTTDIWNIKQIPGGLVDAEFIAQGLQLIHAYKHPKILHANTAQALQLCVEEGLIEVGDAEILLPAIRLYHDMTQIVRVCLSEGFQPDATAKALRDVVVRASYEPDMARLEARLIEYQDAVRGCFERLMAPIPK
ncbi:bifunctional [glutamine synthetase] adenylyltransferase/[glutamine synthetase]-adenylyl-L-tyrosine phosphorylase [Cohaesibacter celericrescens]|uniref:Bifunctional glutamine synthetase adenylyltransferase/adenylyl-removing enzyme n=1 Tax=Cohaesibacter celericrescens TaxID=2067669 RepID=A0A2N5XR86_9HYPH|nr:bifunctional [glutamine synthetase] adenylyltransferase/[glutamine synthetase]-adenylyl-L-tyrosine phosphorylase [Cohaesibacter celericrescens]PLW76938.1 bifunctional [glutamate--ammonia ligase]-adenylyl-L-tyrosine phosphorylase/[glutamate--ammonia-ligase] adenylyltransferase [Cohaesibacter celericrescens]